MFDTTPDQTRSAPRTLRGVVRNAVDLLVAFTTLESYSVEDLWPSRDEASETSHRTGTPTPTLHPHRDRLRSPERARRPGRPAATHHHCTTPVAPEATRRRTPSAGRPVLTTD